LAHDPEYIEKHFRHIEPATGRRFQPITLTGSGLRHGESGEPWRSINPTDVGRHWAVPGAAIASLEGLLGWAPEDTQKMSVQDKLDALDSAGMVYWPQKEGGVPRFKHYADALTGVALSDMWTDIDPISSHAAERLGYPTQKPLALMESVISASSNPGDLVLDPFCGCGTAIAAAQKLGRKWIGIDITHLSVALMKYRLQDMYPGIDIRVVGEPEDLGGARQLADDDRYQFQWWALSLIRAKPLGANKAGGKTGKKGADQGIDGVINFFDDGSTPKRVLVQVKSGKVSSRDIRDLVGTLDREKAQIGVFLTLEDPSGPMKKEAVSAGYYRSQGWGKDFPRMQILTPHGRAASPRCSGRDATPARHVPGSAEGEGTGA